ncbi:MAG: S9 family peptidase [Sphingomonadales bacterium]|nr:S9 family peptidase [Sphingomonadales bacterium]MDE2623609.1 S9 family peptidase [Betaproteobacteria bacterium]
MRRFALAALAATLLSEPVQAAPPLPPDLAEFLSYPFIAELSAPATGGALAWVETREGVRNVWLARGPDFSAKKLTQGTSDDGMELTELTWSPDGKVLVWVRGGGESNSWAAGYPAPNPASLAQQPVQEVWASVEGAAPVKLGEGADPVVSASGRVAYIKDNQPWVVDAHAPTKPEKLLTDRGKVSSLVWSPDGTKLAFVSKRLEHSLIGVYSGPDQPIVWLAPSTGTDADPVWSPDGKRLAWTRRTGTPDLIANLLKEQPNPFSIWTADAASGEGQKLWQSPATFNGSYPEVPDGLFLNWGPNDTLTFRAEMDGWAHLYALPTTGGTPRLLTPGDCIVEHVSTVPDGSALTYDSNCGKGAGDIDRRHVSRVTLATGKIQNLTSGTGIEFVPATPGKDSAAWIASTPTTPMRVTLSQGGKTLVLSQSSTYAPKGMVVPKPVIFTASDGQTVHGQLFQTASAKAQPALVFVHGGPPRQMLLGWSYMDYYAHAYAMNQYYAAHGYTVLSVNYRLGIGYGRAFQHPEGAGLTGNTEYRDVLAGAKFLAAQNGVDSKRIGIWGGSYGGLLVAHALALNSDLFKAGVDFHGVHDWTNFLERINGPRRYDQPGYDQVMKTAWESSPISELKGWTSPVLLISGDDDRNVRFDQTITLAQRLAAQGTPFEELILPNEIHGFLRHQSWVKADAASVRFLARELEK